MTTPSFGNFERLLPAETGGYYKEFTVRTPGESDRGARRIVTGRGGEKYYTRTTTNRFIFIVKANRAPMKIYSADTWTIDELREQVVRRRPPRSW